MFENLSAIRCSPDLTAGKLPHRRGGARRRPVCERSVTIERRARNLPPEWAVSILGTKREILLLDLVGARRLADPLASWLAQHRPDWVRLSPSEPARRARRDERWRLLVNARVEPDV